MQNNTTQCTDWRTVYGLTHSVPTDAQCTDWGTVYRLTHSVPTDVQCTDWRTVYRLTHSVPTDAVYLLTQCTYWHSVLLQYGHDVMVTMSWSRCHDHDVMITMSWWRCHDHDVMITMSWSRCHGHDVMVTMHIPIIDHSFLATDFTSKSTPVTFVINKSHRHSFQFFNNDNCWHEINCLWKV